jgi:hypothetical protein
MIDLKIVQNAISVRLSSDASTIEQVVGIRLGIMCEVFALSCFGLLFGLFFSWELTMIVFLTILIIIVTASLNVHLNVYLEKQSGPLLQRANTVRSEFDPEVFLCLANPTPLH